MPWKKIATIVSILVGLTILSGVGYKGYCHFAKTSEVKQLAMRLNQKIIQDRIQYLQDRIWKIEDRYRNRPMPPGESDTLRRLREDIKALERQLVALPKHG